MFSRAFRTLAPLSRSHVVNPRFHPSIIRGTHPLLRCTPRPNYLRSGTLPSHAIAISNGTRHWSLWTQSPREQARQRASGRLMYFNEGLALFITLIIYSMLGNWHTAKPEKQLKVTQQENRTAQLDESAQPLDEFSADDQAYHSSNASPKL